MAPATPFAGIEAAVGREVLARFPQAERVREYGIGGWRVRRPVRVEWTHGTVDPNFLLIGLADRKQGTTLHVLNPVDWKGMGRRKRELEAAGLKVMVGCVQFTRKQPYPMEAVRLLLDDAKAALDADAGQVPPYRTPRPRTKKAKKTKKAKGAKPRRRAPASASRPRRTPRRR